MQLRPYSTQPSFLLWFSLDGVSRAHALSHQSPRDPYENKWQYLANALSNILCICLQTPHTYFSDEIQIYMEACTVQWFINEVIFVASLVSLIPFLNNFLVPNRSISAAYGLRNEIDIFVRQPMITHHTDSKNISTSSQLANRNSHHPHSWTQSQHKLTFSVWYVNFMFNFGQTLHVLGDLYTD